MTSNAHHDLTAIGLTSLVDEFQRRRLDQLSDVELIAAVGRVVSEPRRDPADSFVLHAPLELAARAALLPHVAPDRRELARMHIVAIAAQYEAFGPPLASVGSVSDPTDVDWAISAFRDAVAEGDLERTDSAAQGVASMLDPDEMAGALADFVTPLTAAAAHAPIFLNLSLRGDPRCGITTALLRPLARELARHPAWRVGWTDDRFADRATDPATLRDALATTPHVGGDDGDDIHALIDNVDASGAAERHLGDVVGRHDPEAARSVLRCAALSMLQDSAKHAPYGWTHCLTLPQAVLGVAPLCSDSDRSLAIAATHVMAFRAGLGETMLDPTAQIDPSPVKVTRLLTQAATSHDAHIVKYTLACLDATTDDPEFAGLYLAAAQHLLDVWADRGGDPSDPLADR